MWHSLRLNHRIHVTRKRVVNILCELNPAVTRERRSRRLARWRYTSYSPNFCWHVVTAQTAESYLQIESVNRKQHSFHISINKQSSKIIIGQNKLFSLSLQGGVRKKIHWCSFLNSQHFSFTFQIILYCKDKFDTDRMLGQ